MTEAQLRAGGALWPDDVYINRPADNALLTALLQNEFAYVSAPHQVGKTSLSVRTINRLAQEGILSARADLASVGFDNSDERWYFSVLQEFSFSQGVIDDPAAYWFAHTESPPAHRWLNYLRRELAPKVPERLVLFIDEIDYLPRVGFSRKDFFAGLRALYDARAHDPHCRKITFCLLGTAFPADLVTSTAPAPLNLGRSVPLRDFTREEARGLCCLFEALPLDPVPILDAIHGWTSGHPAMTQQLCAALLAAFSEDTTASQMSASDLVAKVVHERFFAPTAPVNPSILVAQLDFSRQNVRPTTARMLDLYDRLLTDQPVIADTRDPVQAALKLTGLAADSFPPSAGGPRLRVRNKIFEHFFSTDWVHERQAERPFAEHLRRWLDSRQSDASLPIGPALEQLLAWARERTDLTATEQAFVLAATGKESARQARATRRRGLAVLILASAVIIAAVSTTFALRARSDARAAALAAQRGRAEANGSRARLLARTPETQGEALRLAIATAAPFLTSQETMPDEVRRGLADAVFAGNGVKVFREPGTTITGAEFLAEGTLAWISTVRPQPNKVRGRHVGAMSRCVSN